MSSQQRQPTRVSLTIGETRRLTEFDFSKISVSLERDLAPLENPLDAYRDVNALLSRALAELQAGKPPQIPNALGKQALPPSAPASKLATLQEKLGARLQDLEITEGFDGLSVKPKRYLGDVWAEVNEVIRALGGHWQKGQTSRDGSWRIPK
jgi:hypothetical protein